MRFSFLLMALLKTPEEIHFMREGGALLSRALSAAVAAVAPGVSLKELDRIAEQTIREGGGTPSFLGYKTKKSDTPFPSTVCISVNEEVVHGLGNRDRRLIEGDLVGLDIGCWYKGLCTDMAVTVPVGDISAEAKRLREVTRRALLAGIDAAKIGGTIRDISSAIEEVADVAHLGIVRALVGHGVGHAVHEEPHVPNYVDMRAPVVHLKEGMCLALEPMFGLGGGEVITAKDGWAVEMADGKLGAHFEATIACTKEGIEILTPLPA